MDGLERDTQLLRSIAERYRLTPAALAREIGVAKTTINRPFNGTATTQLSRPTINKLRDRFPDFPEWASASSDEALLSVDDTVDVDSIDLSFGLGGTFVDVEPGSIEIEKAKFSRSWLRKFTHSPPEMLFTTSGIGDSMRPTIEDADVVIVDRSENLRDSLGEKIWAVVFGGVGMIKRLRPMPDGTVKIMSDNRVVPDDVATDGDLHVVGRVVAVVRRQ